MDNRLGIDAAKKIRIKEWFGLMVLGGLVVFFLVTSWRKWPDPLIDFGCEIYSPWRLANGAVRVRIIARRRESGMRGGARMPTGAGRNHVRLRVGC